MIRHARVQTREQLARALESAIDRRAAVFYTLVDPTLREAMVEIAHASRLVVHDVLGPALNAITTASGREASLVPAAAPRSTPSTSAASPRSSSRSSTTTAAAPTTCTRRTSS